MNTFANYGDGYGAGTYEPRAVEDQFPLESTEPLKKSIDNLFAKVVKKYARGRNFFIAHQILTHDDPEKTKLPILGTIREHDDNDIRKLETLRQFTDSIIQGATRETPDYITLEDIPKVMKYVADFVNNIEIQINPDIEIQINPDYKKEVKLIPHDRQGKILGINDKLYCPAIHIFKKLLDGLSIETPDSPYTFTIEEPREDSSYKKNMTKCESYGSQALGGGSKSRRRHRRKPARKTRRKSKTKAKPKTHRRRRHSRIRKHKKNTYKRLR